jgi:heterodisulfide reductase subunit A
VPNDRVMKAPAEDRGDPLKDNVRIGVYVCHCGGNISDIVDCAEVADELCKEPNVVVSRTNESMCSDTGQAGIMEDIRTHGINRVVIGACAPSLHEQTFRNTLSRAGLNSYLYYHVGLREQVSWVHFTDREAATSKAVRLMRAGVAKARHLEPLAPIRLEAVRHVLVIGGGIAGLRSALDMGRRGLKVTLIEQSPFLGGRVAQLESLFPTGESARDLLRTLIAAVRAEQNITVHTRAELVGLRGYVGNFHARLRITPRGVDEVFADLDAAAEVCPVEVPDEHNYGLTQRKAIYRPYEGCYPAAPAIDWEHCTRCGDCAKAVGRGITLERQVKELELSVGAIVVATGFDPYEPRPDEFGYITNRGVVTLPQFIRLLALNGERDTLRVHGRAVRSIAMIHCVGSRQIKGRDEPQEDGEVNSYCSRVCCTATLHIANEVRERFPAVNVFDFCEDIRTYGRGHEEYYTDASLNRVRFLRFRADDRPHVVCAENGEPAPLLVRVADHLTWGEEVEVPVDLVVLAVSMMPRKVDSLTELLKISPGRDRFLLEVHPKLRPVETAVRGVVLAGTAQGPMNIQESCASASAAAAKVSAMLASGEVELDPFVAHVDTGRCDGTGSCIDACQYEEAITLVTRTLNGADVQRAEITPANCMGCGVCVGACPNRAVVVKGWTLDQYDAMVDAIAAESPVQEVGV